MKKQILQLASLLLVIFFTVAIASAQTDAELKAKIEKLNKEMSAAMMSGNSEKSMSFYADDAISMPNYGKMVEGKAALKASNEEMMKSGMKITAFETTTLKVMSSGKMITEIGHYSIAMSIPGKADPMKEEG